MKYSELHRLIRQNGWKIISQKGSHVKYAKGDETYTVPYHGGKEVPLGTECGTRKDMNLKKIVP
jgi:predicted RNA binding protein YcfA (HicA-like mRNA interferase family)